LAISPLQAGWVSRTLGLADDDELLSDLRLLFADGRQIGGADVYRHVMRRIWWAYPLYLFSIAPLSRRAFDWGYRTFAANRYRISGACRFEPIPKADVRAVPDDNMRLPGVNTRSKTVPSAASTSIRGARARVSR